MASGIINYKKSNSIIDEVLKNKLDKTEFDNLTIGGRNLLVLYALTKDCYLNYKGEVVSNTDWSISDYIKVTPGTPIIASGYTNLGDSPSTCFYDSSKNFVSGIVNGNSIVTVTEETMKKDQRRLVIVPSGCSYMRFSFMTRDTNIMLERGNKASDYTPSPEDVQYQIDSIEIGGRNILRYSDNFKIDNSRVSGWNNAGSLSILQEDGEYIAKISASGRTTNVINSIYSSYYPCKKGDKFVASVWFRITDISVWDVKKPYVFEVYDANDNRVQFKDVDITDTNTNNPTVVNGEWIRITSTHTVTVDNADRVGLRLTLFKNGEISFKKPKLEFGTKVTDWTPAPEDVQDQINSIQNPTFDDSGTTEGINSFTDFMNSVKSKMNIFQFFRDFKAGMKYVLHTGRLANNAITTEEGFALDARMGKVLQDQITDVNNNIDASKFVIGSIKEFGANCKKGITVFSTGAPSLDLPEQTIEWQYTSGYVIKRDETGISLTIVLYSRKTNKTAKICCIENEWSDWEIDVKNSDLTPSNIIVKTIKLDSFFCELKYFTLNNVCYVSINGLYNTKTIERVILGSDLPKPLTGVYTPMINDVTGDSVGIIYIFANESIINYRARKVVTSGRGYISFSYVIA